MMDYPIALWRLVQTPPANGPWNMAIDEAILEAAGRGEVPPTLRLYSWEPPCLSLGYSQPVADVDHAALESHGWDLVRRPTGGRAILHTDEITYSVIGPYSEPRLAGSVLESYSRLSTALLKALQNLGIPAESQSEAPITGTGNTRGPVCFETPSSYEITANGKKLVGSAQARKREGVLQHGSLPLLGDLTRITQALVFPIQEGSRLAREKAAQRLRQRAATVDELLGHEITWDEAAQAFIAAFNQTLNLELIAAVLTDGELTRAKELVQVKYAHPDWTRKV